MKRNLTNGFPRSERVTRGDEIRRLYKAPLRVSVPGAKLFVSDRGLSPGAASPPPVNRIGFTLPRHYGTAVQRNRTKRLCREAFRQHKCALKGGHDLLLLLFPPLSPGGTSLRDTFAARSSQLRRLCQKAGLL